VKETKLYGFARNNKREFRRFGKFALVGFSGLIVDYLVLNVLTQLFNINAVIAIAVAFICAATSNYVWNRLWVYPETRAVQKRRQMPTFIGVNAIGLGINWLMYFVLHDPLTALLRSSFLGLNITKAISAVIVMMWNFVVNRLVTFKGANRVAAAAAAAEHELPPVDSAL
jgi:putative flippase GtrA